MQNEMFNEINNSETKTEELSIFEIKELFDAATTTEDKDYYRNLLITTNQ